MAAIGMVAGYENGTGYEKSMVLEDVHTVSDGVGKSYIRSSEDRDFSGLWATIASQK